MQTSNSLRDLARQTIPMATIKQRHNKPEFVNSRPLYREEDETSGLSAHRSKHCTMPPSNASPNYQATHDGTT
jgi:hypothetical protein